MISRTRKGTSFIMILLVILNAVAVASAAYSLVQSGSSSSQLDSSYSTQYMSNLVGQCSYRLTYIPCFDFFVGNAEVFNCTATAETASGCTKIVTDPTATQNNFVITIWYPISNQTGESSNFNLMYQVKGEPGSWYGIFDPINSTAFIITMPGLKGHF